MARKIRYDKHLGRLRDRDIDQTDVQITGGTISGTTIADNFTSATDPAVDAAVSASIVQNYNGVLITTTTTGNNQELANPSVTAQVKRFTVSNNETSTDSITAIANSVSYVIPAGKSKSFVWDGSAWYPASLGIEELPVKVTQGGTGRNALTAHKMIVGNGASQVTELDVMETGEILKGATGADPSALSANTDAIKKSLRSTGTGTAGQDPEWAVDIPAGVEDNLVSIDGVGNVKDSGVPSSYIDQDVSTGGSPSFAEVETDRAATPVVEFKDSDCTDDDVNANIEIEATDTVSGQEDVDVYFKQQVNGSLVSFMFSDADGDLEISKDIAPQNRLLGKKGADVLSANDLSLTVGNYFVVTGTTTINGIATAGWTAGSRVLLEFASTPTVKHNTAASSGYASILVSGGADHVAVAGDIVEIIYNGTNWLLREIWSAS